MTIADLQIQANFPLLASATVLLDRRLRQGKYERVLLSSRDCYMQAHLWRQMFPGTSYEVIYWMTSRWARIKGSDRYLDYCRRLFKGKVLIVDLCGSSESLCCLFDRLNLHPDYLIVQSDPRKNAHRFLDGPGDLEGLNCAPHASIIDVTEGEEPIYQYPKIDWRKYFQEIGGQVFLEQAHRPEFSEYIDAPEDALMSRMKTAEQAILAADHLFEPFHAMRRSEDWQ